MNVVKRSIEEVKKGAISGGLALKAAALKPTEIRLLSQGNLTKTGKQGVNTSLGWLNADLLIKHLSEQPDGHQGKAQMLKVNPDSYELRVDPNFVFFIKGDADGNNIIEVSMSAPATVVPPVAATTAAPTW